MRFHSMQSWILRNRSVNNPNEPMKTLLPIIVATGLTLGMHANAADAATIYSKECAKCHGAAGKGDTKMGKKLKVKDLTVEVGKLSDAQIAASIKEGVMEGGKMRMKPIKGLSDADVAALVAYVKSLK